MMKKRLGEKQNGVGGFPPSCKLAAAAREVHHRQVVIRWASTYGVEAAAAAEQEIVEEGARQRVIDSRWLSTLAEASKLALE